MAVEIISRLLTDQTLSFTKLFGFFICITCFLLSSFPRKVHLNITEKDKAKDIVPTGVFSYTFRQKHLSAALSFIFGFLIYVAPDLFTQFGLPLKSGLIVNGHLNPWNIWDQVGIFLCIVGYLLREWSFQTLGHHFTYIVTIKENHQLIQNGPYKYLMHPSYTALLLVNSGFLLYSGYVFDTLFWTLLLSFCGLMYFRIKNEEAVLKENFKEEFDKYAKSRYRLIPFLL